MPRIADAEVARLKQEVSLQRLVEAKGIELKRHGGDLIGRCPFHDDKTPSLVVSPEKNLWHCMGACQAGGSVIDWVMKAEGVSFRHAVELLKNDTPFLAAVDARVIKHATKPKLSAVLARDADDDRLLLQVVDYYHATLKETPEALAYLQKRGLQSAEMIAHFKLGFSNRTLGYRLPQANRAEGADLRGHLMKVGILRESGHEHFRGSLTIPILDDEGRVSEMYGRKINDNLREGTAYHTYLPGPHRGVWNHAALVGNEEIILCEALIDALTFWCAGFRNVTASYGIEGFTADHLAAFKAHGTKRVMIAYDRDDAGERAAEKLATRLMAEGIECFRVQFPKGMDANAYALSLKPAEKSLGVALRSAVWLGKGAVPAREQTKTAAKEEMPSTGPADETSIAPAPPPALEQVSLLAADPKPIEPRAPSSALQCEHAGEDLILMLGDRKWRVRGLAKNTSYEALRVNLLCSHADAFHVDTLDLYAARLRAAFLKQASQELRLSEDVLKSDLAKILLKLEALLDQQIQKTLAPADEKPKMTETERDEALALLRDPQLCDRILADFDAAGIVGEETNKLVGYLAAVSRKLDDPLAVIIQSSSAAGKTSLMDAILAFVPDEERIKYSAMTGQSLFYMGETNLKHKVLAVSEEEGAERAVYALKLLQSEGELTIASTGKDPATGRLITHEYRVEGPVMIMLTTTAHEIDEELLNRCLVLAVSEDRAQTRAIQVRQRAAQTLDGLLSRRARSRLVTLHQNAQRLLQPLLVANPFAERLTFLDDVTRTRRDHQKYLTLIRAVALLHQHQRPLKFAEHHGERIEYIEVSSADIAIANRLCVEVFARSRDALPPQSRRLLRLIEEMVQDACTAQKIPRDLYRFSRRAVCESTGWSLTQVRLHLARLMEHELVLCHRGDRGQSFVYELCRESAERQASDAGLADVSMKQTLAGGGVVVAEAPPPPQNQSSGAVLAPPWRGVHKATSGDAGTGAHHSVGTRPVGTRRAVETAS